MQVLVILTGLSFYFFVAADLLHVARELRELEASWSGASSRHGVQRVAARAGGVGVDTDSAYGEVRGSRCAAGATVGPTLTLEGEASADRTDSLEYF